MRVSVEKTSDLERRLTIAVPAEQFESELSSKLAATRGQVRLPGFRPGKVPMKEVRRRFGAAARQETANDLMRSGLSEAIEQEDLTPAGMPNLEILNLDPGVDFQFAATFEVFPPVELADFTTFEFTQPICEITESDIDDMVQRLREQRREWEDVERGAEEGDRVVLDFEGTLDGEPFEGGKGEGVTFDVGTGRMIEDFDRAVRGLAAGEHKTFPADFPEDYQSEELAGKTVQFTVDVQAVKAPRLPEVDEAFFQAFGVEEGGEAAFREEVTGNMRRELDAAIRTQIKGRVMEKLADAHDIPLPQALVHQEVHAIKDRVLQRVQAQETESVSLPDDLFKEQAERQVKLGLISREIIRLHELTADSERVRARIEELAQPYADKDQVIAWYYQSEEQLAGIESAVLEDQVVDTVLDQAEVSLQERPYADIIAGDSAKEAKESDQDE